MRALVLGLALLAAVAWGRAAAAASVVVDVVAEHIALDVGDRDVWSVWLRSTTDVEVSSVEIAVITDGIESIEFDVLSHYLEPDYPSPGLAYLVAFNFPLLPSVRIATLTRTPLDSPPHVILVPGLVPMENTILDYPSIFPTNSSGSPLSVLSLTQPFFPYCPGPACEIPVAPQTYSRWLWELPEPHAATLLAAALALLALRRRA